VFSRETEKQTRPTREQGAMSLDQRQLHGQVTLVRHCPKTDNRLEKITNTTTQSIKRARYIRRLESMLCKYMNTVHSHVCCVFFWSKLSVVAYIEKRPEDMGEYIRNRVRENTACFRNRQHGETDSI